MVTDTSNFSAATQTYYRKQAFDFARKNLYFQRSGMQENIPDNGGQTISVYRVDNMAAATTPISEGVVPSDVNLTSTTYSALILQYGNWGKYSDLVDVTGRTPFQDAVVPQFGYNAALSLDTVTYSAYKSGALAVYAGGKDAGTFNSDSVFSAKEVRRLGKRFKANAVPGIPQMDNLWLLFIHPDCEFDFQTDDKMGSLLDLQKREPENENKWKGVNGVYAGFAIFQTSLIDTTSLTGDGNGPYTAYRNIAVGYGALLNVGLKGMPFQLYRNPTTNVTLSNPMAQLGSIAWKAAYVAKYIGDDVNRALLVYAVATEPTA